MQKKALEKRTGRFCRAESPRHTISRGLCTGDICTQRQHQLQGVPSVPLSRFECTAVVSKTQSGLSGLHFDLLCVVAKAQHLFAKSVPTVGQKVRSIRFRCQPQADRAVTGQRGRHTHSPSSSARSLRQKKVAEQLASLGKRSDCVGQIIKPPA